MATSTRVFELDPPFQKWVSKGDFANGPGASDISFVARDVDGLVGLGPASSGDHTADETMNIPSLFRQAKRAAILMSRLAAEHAVASPNTKG